MDRDTTLSVSGSFRELKSWNDFENNIINQKVKLDPKVWGYRCTFLNLKQVGVHYSAKNANPLSAYSSFPNI